MLWEEIRLAKDTDVLALHAALGPGAGQHPFARVIGFPQVLGRLAAGARMKRAAGSHSACHLQSGSPCHGSVHSRPDAACTLE